MSDRDGLYAAIFANPDDDAPRLVLADWLEENGQSKRAEFIRLQVEAARLPKGKARTALEGRAGRISAKHGPDWLSGTGLTPAEVGFHRGFPDELTLTDGVGEVESEDEEPEEDPLASRLTALRSWPELGCVRRLHFYSESGDGGNGEGVVRVLADAREYGRVAELTLTGLIVNPEDLERLATSKTLKRLRVLSLLPFSNNAPQEVGEEGCEVIAGSRNFAHLEVLELPYSGVGDAGAAALAGSRHLKNLRQLDLSDNEVGDEGVEALAGSRHLKNLRQLNLSSNDIGDAGVNALAAARLPCLETIILDDNDGDVSDEAMEALEARYGEPTEE